MQYGRVRAAVVLVLAVAALGAAGASLDASGTGGGSPGAGEGSGVGIGAGEGGILPAFDPPEGGGDARWIGYLFAVAVLGGMIYAVVFLLQALVNWGWDDLVAFLRTNAGRALGALVLLGAAYLLFRFFPSIPEGGGSTGLVGDAEGPGSGPVADATGVDLPVGVVLAVAALVVLVLALAVRSARAGDDGEVPAPAPAAPGTPEASPGSSGDTRGSAFGLDAPPADNEVYRTWLALADAAGADPRHDTPAAVAERAVEAGVDEHAAREATALFEAVRYGGAAPTGERERRARAVRSQVAGASEA